MKYYDYEIIKTKNTTGNPAKETYKIIKDDVVMADEKQMLTSIKECKEYIDIALLTTKTDNKESYYVEYEENGINKNSESFNDYENAENWAKENEITDYRIIGE